MDAVPEQALYTQPLPFRQRLTLYERLLQHDHNRAWLRFLNAVVRGGVSGALLKGGLHLARLLLALLFRRRKQQTGTGLSSWEKLQDAARYAAFLGTFGGSFVAVDEGIAAVFGKRRCDLNVCVPGSPGLQRLTYTLLQHCNSVEVSPDSSDLNSHAGQQLGERMWLGLQQALPSCSQGK